MVFWGSSWFWGENVIGHFYLLWFSLVFWEEVSVICSGFEVSLADAWFWSCDAADVGHESASYGEGFTSILGENSWCVIYDSANIVSCLRSVSKNALTIEVIIFLTELLIFLEENFSISKEMKWSKRRGSRAHLQFNILLCLSIDLNQAWKKVSQILFTNVLL